MLAEHEKNRFSAACGALMQLPFIGYLTTNYDPSILEARLALLSGDCTHNFATWKDGDLLYRWYTGDIFSEYQRPILFAYGIYNRSDTILLDIEDYRGAYKAGLYRRVFERLWGQLQMIFVGYGFSDYWLDFIAQEVISQTSVAVAADVRHVALVGLDQDRAYTPEIRRMFHSQYNIEPCFYEVTVDDAGVPHHDNLITLLERLRDRATDTS